MLTPYVSVENDQVRFSVRVRDSEKSLKRDGLLKKIRHDLVSNFGLKTEQVHLSGMLVLYNNMLQSLFRSQILTLGVVILALMGMFMILFRSLKIACIAIFPNLLSIGVVLGVMGWLKIPLDMMTITIASISVGIAVDDTIHYIHRFKSEMAMDPNYIRGNASVSWQHRPCNVLYIGDHHHRFFNPGVVQFYSQYLFRPSDRIGHVHCLNCFADAVAPVIDPF